MDKIKRFNVMFIGGCIGAAIAVCVATALGMIQLIRWNLSNCGSSPGCSASDWLISYWWLIFVSGALVVAWVLRRIYDRRYARLIRDN